MAANLLTLQDLLKKRSPSIDFSEEEEPGPDNLQDKIRFDMSTFSMIQYKEINLDAPQLVQYLDELKAAVIYYLGTGWPAIFEHLRDLHKVAYITHRQDAVSLKYIILTLWARISRGLEDRKLDDRRKELLWRLPTLLWRLEGVGNDVPVAIVSGLNVLTTSYMATSMRNLSRIRFVQESVVQNPIDSNRLAKESFHGDVLISGLRGVNSVPTEQEQIAIWLSFVGQVNLATISSQVPQVPGIERTVVGRHPVRLDYLITDFHSLARWIYWIVQLDPRRITDSHSNKIQALFNVESRSFSLV